ncbi:MAG: molybdopterin-dependent oxidoreductase, partial [Ottowia sp.]|nr:molybdopterin-dependent oxidoreductase [Ottowia sp.]
WGSFEAAIENGRLDRTRPFRRDRNPSALTDVIPEAVYASSRVRAPAVREGWLEGRASSRRERGNERFVEVDWETALDLVSSELARIRSDFGAEAIFGGSYGWSSAGRLHHARTLLHRMLHAGGGCVGQVTNYSYAAGMVILPHVVGNADPVSGRMTDWRAIVENAGLMVFFGGINRRNF